MMVAMEAQGVPVVVPTSGTVQLVSMLTAILRKPVQGYLVVAGTMIAVAPRHGPTVIGVRFNTANNGLEVILSIQYNMT